MVSSSQLGKINRESFWKSKDKNTRNNLMHQPFGSHTLVNVLGGILKSPTAGSILSALWKATSGRNHAHVTWTHRDWTSVGFNAPPEHGILQLIELKKNYKTHNCHKRNIKLYQMTCLLQDTGNIPYQVLGFHKLGKPMK